MIKIAVMETFLSMFQALEPETILKYISITVTVLPYFETFHSWLMMYLLISGLPANLKLKEPCLSEWTIQKSIWNTLKSTKDKILVPVESRTFYTDERGYHVNFLGQINVYEKVVYFAVRVLPGSYDSSLTWPFQSQFKIRLSDKMQCGNVEDWLLPPSGAWKAQIMKTS